VRNLSDGSVEAVFAGSDFAVVAMIVACRNGPPSSEVEAIDEMIGTMADLALRDGTGFVVLPTA